MLCAERNWRAGCRWFLPSLMLAGLAFAAMECWLGPRADREGGSLLQGRSSVYAKEKPDEQLAQLMKRKLEAAQKILEGLALANFDSIVTNAETLIFISRQASFRVLPTPEYELHSNEFRRIAGELANKAREKNLDGATLQYMDLTLTCVKCHKHVRDRRGAHLENPLPRDLPAGIAQRVAPSD